MTFEEFCVAYVKNALDSGSMTCSCCPLSDECEKDAHVKWKNEDELCDLEMCSDFIQRVCGGK